MGRSAGGGGGHLAAAVDLARAGCRGGDRERRESNGQGWGSLVSVLFAVRLSLPSAFLPLCRLLADGKEVAR